MMDLKRKRQRTIRLIESRGLRLDLIQLDELDPRARTRNRE
ncbi:hypothetical protein ACKVEX_05460 [Rhodocyclaceae bacterium SMB388]